MTILNKRGLCLSLLVLFCHPTIVWIPKRFHFLTSCFLFRKNTRKCMYKFGIVKIYNDAIYFTYRSTYFTQCVHLFDDEFHVFHQMLSHISSTISFISPNAVHSTEQQKYASDVKHVSNKLSHLWIAPVRIHWRNNKCFKNFRKKSTFSCKLCFFLKYL